MNYMFYSKVFILHRSRIQRGLTKIALNVANKYRFSYAYLYHALANNTFFLINQLQEIPPIWYFSQLLQFADF